MITVRLNGSEQDVTATTVADLMAELRIAGAPRGLAVAVNGAVVPRASWDERNLAAGDEIEVVRATQGG
ncbi:MAG TPA: sulfur carrier protein ThiS [Stellaceae bacterium]|nr:sulfur carrier protein ThiS [Stellaceae bacterium]